MRSRKRLAEPAAALLVCASVVFGLVGSDWQTTARASTALQQPSPATVLAQVPLRAPRRIDIMINGQGPFSFGFDTGASGDAWVTRALVSKLHLPTIDRMRVSDGSGVNSREVETVRIDSLRLGELSFEGLRVPVLGDGPKKDDDTDAYGTLGFELFRDYLLTLDYPENQLRVATGQLPDADGLTVLNYFLDFRSPHIEIHLAGRRVRAQIDSGSGGGVVLPPPFAKTLPLRGPLRPAGKVASSLGVFDLFQGALDGNLKVGAFTFPQPVLFFSELVETPNVGRNIIRTFAVTFDQKNRRVQFAQP